MKKAMRAFVVILVMVVMTGLGNAGDFGTTLQKAAAGDTDAQFSLGVMYYDGNGVPQDKKKAFEWYAKAANQGDADAQNILGVMYYDGNGVPQDKKKAFEWLVKAAEQGHAEAKLNVEKARAEAKLNDEEARAEAKLNVEKARAKSKRENKILSIKVLKSGPAAIAKNQEIAFANEVFKDKPLLQKNPYEAQRPVIVQITVQCLNVAGRNIFSFNHETTQTKDKWGEWKFNDILFKAKVEGEAGNFCEKK